MNRLFRNTTPTASDYAGLALFAVIYLGALTFVVAPETFVAQPTPQALSFTSD